MASEQIIFTGKTKKHRELLVRYPMKSDVEAMWRYINTLSREKTYIRFQGEEISLEDEKHYLDGQLEKISKHESVELLGFVKGELIGIAGVDMKDRIERHVGVLGISVAKGFRGEGIGSFLMALVIDEAIKRLSKLEIFSLCVFSNNLEAIRLYEQFGFFEYGKLPQGFKLDSGYVDRILMYKPVTKD
jgi:ribosomal protein S18 acetylase RimI-like enzyme